MNNAFLTISILELINKIYGIPINLNEIFTYKLYKKSVLRKLLSHSLYIKDSKGWLLDQTQVLTSPTCIMTYDFLIHALSCMHNSMKHVPIHTGSGATRFERSQRRLRTCEIKPCYNINKVYYVRYAFILTKGRSLASHIPSLSVLYSSCFACFCAQILGTDLLW